MFSTVVKPLFFFVVVVTFSLTTAAQLSNELPRLMRPSPEISQVTKYNEYSIDYKSGTPQISVPIFQINTGSLTMPIGLSYTSNGRKAWDAPGSIAIGWSLNAGGSISRSVRGRPDNLAYMPTTIKSQGSIHNETDYDFLADIHYGNKDGAYDIYTYQIPSESGKFIMDHDGTGYEGPILFKPSAVKFPTGSSDMPSSLLDGQGNYYGFAVDETIQSDPYTTLNFVTSKLLSQIISADKKDTISITYLPFTISDHCPDDQFVLQDNNQSVGDNQIRITYPSTANGYNTYYVKKIEQIMYREGKVKFVYAGPSYTWGKLERIEIYDQQNKICKQFSISTGVIAIDSPTLAGTYRKHKLDAVVFRDGNGTEVQKYLFEYEPSLYSISTNRDYWGYVNSGSNLTAIPTIPEISVSALTGASTYTYPSTKVGNRNPDISAKWGMLKKVTFPTGGVVEFEYEINKYMKLGNVVNGPGVRVKKLTMKSTSGDARVKEFTYGNAENGYGSLPWYGFDYLDLSFEKICYPHGSTYPYGFYRTRTYTSKLTPELEELASIPVMYNQVTEYNGTVTSNLGKTEYFFRIPNSYQAGNAMYEYFGTLPAGSNYYTSNQTRVGRDMVRRGIYVTNYLGEYVDLGYKIYKKEGSNYSLIKNVVKNYSSPVVTTYKGIGVFKYIEVGSNGSVNPSFRPMNEKSLAEYEKFPIFEWLNTDLNIGYQLLDFVTESETTPSGTITKTTNYTYNDKGLPKTASIVSSNTSLKKETTFKYPMDFVTDPGIGSISTLMVGSNMLNYTIESISKTIDIPTNIDKSIQFSKALFSNSTGRVLLQASYSARAGSGYNTDVLYNSYDERGNIREIQKEGNVKMQYLWNYNGIYPVMEAVNAESNEVAYTSFEGENRLGWSGLVDQNIVESASSVTGRRMYRLASSISKAGLNSSKTYLISYWTKGSGFLVNGGSGTMKMAKNGWNRYEHTVSNPASGTITISGTSAFIDEVRVAPVGVGMLTKSYDPQIGITSECDANHSIKYYTYDSYGRLIMIRDHALNVLKTFCYQYYSNGANACTIYGNAYVYSNFTKNNCTGCTYPTQNGWGVNANSYFSSVSQADADQQANAEIAANGQSYANAVGICNSPVSATVTGTNTTSTTYNVYFNNVNVSCSPTSYYKTIYGNTGSTAIGPMMTGGYNVTFTPSGSSSANVLRVNSFTLYANSGTINNVGLLSAGNTVSINQ